ncbi:MAG: ribonuclease [Xanthomonadales bacterium]|nr:ribonuclease [Xanthomonadales bacterium]
MRFLKLLVLVAALGALAWFWQQPPGWTGVHERAGQSAPAARGLPAFLPPEAANTLELIARGGPFPYRQDGAVFQNRERRLPQAPRGTYREYTVPTPGARDRGARRIVAAGTPPSA